MKKKIAITGGIGSGKSAVLHIFEEMGYPTFSCDEIYRDVIQSPSYIQKISEVFPECILEGKIDRKLLAQLVFQNEEKLAILNAIAHPLIMERLSQNMDNCNGDTVFAEVPLLFEGNYENLFDKVIVVLRNKEARIQSVIQRDQISEQSVKNRINSQFDFEDPKNEIRLKNCNVIFIKNQGDLSALKNKILSLVL